MALTLGDIKNEVYKALGEYSPVAGDIDPALTYRVGNLINSYYCKLAEKNMITAVYNINHYPAPNLLSDNYSCYTYTDTAINFIAASAQSWWIEVNHSCYIDIQESTSLGYCTLYTVNVPEISVFTPYMGFVTPYSAGNNIKVKVYGDGYYQCKNAGMYAYSFGSVSAAIPDARPYTEYAIPTSYYDIARMEIRQGSVYSVFTDYKQIGKAGGKILISRDGYSAEFLLHYYKQPEFVTDDTSSFEIHDKYLMLIPPAVAGMIMKGNGLNVDAGDSLLEEFKESIAEIDTSKETGKEELINYMQW